MQRHTLCRQLPLVLQTLKLIDFTAILIIVALGIAVAGIQKQQPVQRPVFLQDASIAFKYMGHHAMPFWIALLVPFLVLLAAAVAIEFWLVNCKRRPARVATFINVLLGFMAAIAVVGFMTELFKRMCGRSRWVQ